MKARDIVLVALSSYGGTIHGKTMLQKVCYFADVIADLDLGYKAHFYGPFSPIIEQAVAELKNLGFIEEKALGFGVNKESFGEMRRYDYKLTSDGEEVVEELKKRSPEKFRTIFTTVRRVHDSGNPDYQELSIAAKTYFIARKEGGPITPDEMKKKAQSLGWKLSNDSISNAVNLLKRLDMVNVK